MMEKKRNQGEAKLLRYVKFISEDGKKITTYREYPRYIGGDKHSLFRFSQMLLEKMGTGRGDIYRVLSAESYNEWDPKEDVCKIEFKEMKKKRVLAAC